MPQAGPDPGDERARLFREMEPTGEAGRERRVADRVSTRSPHMLAGIPRLTLVKHTKPLESDTRLYHGTTDEFLGADVKPGSVVTLPDALSFTGRRAVASQYAGHGVVYNLKAPKGTKTFRPADVNGMFPAEDEHVLLKNTRIKITRRVKRKDGTVEVYGEIVRGGGSKLTEAQHDAALMRWLMEAGREGREGALELVEALAERGSSAARGAVARALRRLPDGTFAPKGQGRVLRRGDTVHVPRPGGGTARARVTQPPVGRPGVGAQALAGKVEILDGPEKGKTASLHGHPMGGAASPGTGDGKNPYEGLTPAQRKALFLKRTATPEAEKEHKARVEADQKLSSAKEIENAEKFPMRSKVTTTVHAIGGKSDEVTGEVVGYSRGFVKVKTEAHGTLAVPARDLRKPGAKSPGVPGPGDGFEDNSVSLQDLPDGALFKLKNGDTFVVHKKQGSGVIAKPVKLGPGSKNDPVKAKFFNGMHAPKQVKMPDAAPAPKPVKAKGPGGLNLKNLGPSGKPRNVKAMTDSKLKALSKHPDVEPDLKKRVDAELSKRGLGDKPAGDAPSVPTPAPAAAPGLEDALKASVAASKGKGTPQKGGKTDFGMFSAEGNAQVKKALDDITKDGPVEWEDVLTELEGIGDEATDTAVRDEAWDYLKSRDLLTKASIEKHATPDQSWKKQAMKDQQAKREAELQKALGGKGKPIKGKSMRQVADEQKAEQAAAGKKPLPPVPKMSKALNLKNLGPSGKPRNITAMSDGKLTALLAHPDAEPALKARVRQELSKRGFALPKGASAPGPLGKGPTPAAESHSAVKKLDAPVPVTGLRMERKPDDLNGIAGPSGSDNDKGVITHVVKVSGPQFEAFKKKPLGSYPWLDGLGGNGWVYVSGPGGKGGVVVNPEGGDYARYASKLPAGMKSPLDDVFEPEKGHTPAQAKAAFSGSADSDPKLKAAYTALAKKQAEFAALPADGDKATRAKVAAQVRAAKFRVKKQGGDPAKMPADISAEHGPKGEAGIPKIPEGGSVTTGGSASLDAAVDTIDGALGKLNKDAPGSTGNADQLTAIKGALDSHPDAIKELSNVQLKKLTAVATDNNFHDLAKRAQAAMPHGAGTIYDIQELSGKPPAEQVSIAARQIGGKGWTAEHRDEALSTLAALGVLTPQQAEKLKNDPSVGPAAGDTSPAKAAAAKSEMGAGELVKAADTKAAYEAIPGYDKAATAKIRKATGLSEVPDDEGGDVHVVDGSVYNMNGDLLSTSAPDWTRFEEARQSIFSVKSGEETEVKAASGSPARIFRTDGQPGVVVELPSGERYRYPNANDALDALGFKTNADSSMSLTDVGAKNGEPFAGPSPSELKSSKATRWAGTIEGFPKPVEGYASGPKTAEKALEDNYEYAVSWARNLSPGHKIAAGGPGAGVSIQRADDGTFSVRDSSGKRLAPEDFDSPEIAAIVAAEHVFMRQDAKEFMEANGDPFASLSVPELEAKKALVLGILGDTSAGADAQGKALDDLQAIMALLQKKAG